MYNLIAALSVSGVVFALVGLTVGWIPAVLPALIVFLALTYVLTQRVSRAVEPLMREVQQRVEARDVEGAVGKLREIRDTWGPWQVLLTAQMDAQIGMFSYMQLKFDDALPLLVRGSFRNHLALACIGCIHWRNGKKDEAYKHFEQAADVAPKETSIYVVWAVLAERDGKARDALGALDRGLKVVPEAKSLTALRDTIANQRKVDTKSLGEVWFQFFPEDLLQEHQRAALMRGTRGPAEPPFTHPTPAGAEPKLNRAQRRAAEKSGKR